MVPPPHDLTPALGVPVDGEEGCEEGGHERWSWVFRLLCAAVLAPTAAAIATVQQVLTDEELVAAYGGGPDATLETADHWSLVLVATTLGRPALASAVGLLALAAVALSGRPAWLLPARGRTVVAVLAAVCGSWSALTATLTAHTVLSAPTARQLSDEAQGSPRPTLFDVGPDLALSALVLTAAVAVLPALWQTRRSHPRVVEDAGQGAQSQ